MKISRTDSFKKDYKKLSDELKKSANKQIVQLLIDHTHPSLNLEKLQGLDNIYSIRVNLNFRISLSIFGEELILRRILGHDDLYKNP